MLGKLLFQLQMPNGLERGMLVCLSVCPDVPPHTLNGLPLCGESISLHLLRRLVSPFSLFWFTLCSFHFLFSVTWWRAAAQVGEPPVPPGIPFVRPRRPRPSGPGTPLRPTQQDHQVGGFHDPGSHRLSGEVRLDPGGAKCPCLNST